MEVLIHGIFEIVKISILGCIYATLTLLIFISIGKFMPNSWFAKVSKNKWRLWLKSGLIISIVLFFFMFTYFGDHGLGDSSRIPIGNFKVVKYGPDAYLQNEKGDQLGILNFTFDNKNLYAEIQQWSSEQRGSYVVWNLQSDEWTFYKTKEDYLSAIKNNGYPSIDKFEDFGKHYSRYWSGWRFWLLP